MKFIVPGLEFRDTNGEPFTVSSHIYRHGGVASAHLRRPGGRPRRVAAATIVDRPARYLKRPPTTPKCPLKTSSSCSSITSSSSVRVLTQSDENWLLPTQPRRKPNCSSEPTKRLGQCSSNGTHFTRCCSGTAVGPAYACGACTACFAWAAPTWCPDPSMQTACWAGRRPI